MLSGQGKDAQPPEAAAQLCHGYDADVKNDADWLEAKKVGGLKVGEIVSVHVELDKRKAKKTVDEVDPVDQAAQVLGGQPVLSIRTPPPSILTAQSSSAEPAAGHSMTVCNSASRCSEWR